MPWKTLHTPPTHETKGKGIELVGDATPRAPLSTRFVLGEMYPQRQIADTYKVDSGKQVRKTEVLIAGGGIGGSALFRYFAEAGKKTVLINADRGSSWRNIGGGRPAFSIPELAEIARNNQTIFEETQKNTISITVRYAISRSPTTRLPTMIWNVPAVGPTLI